MMIHSLDWTYTLLPVLFYFDLTLESQSNLVLFWSYTWRLVKLGSVPILHLKASQTWSSNFAMCLLTWTLSSLIWFLTWTYPSLPVWLHFDFITHVYRIGLTPLTPSSWDSLKTLICLNYLFSPEGLSEAFIGCKALFHSASLFQIRKHISNVMCHSLYDCA